MARYRKGAPRIAVFAHACPHGTPDTIEVSVHKGWWMGPGDGGQHRELHRFCIPVPEGEERERMARALDAAAAALRG